jgi:hypothetical protein
LLSGGSPALLVVGTAIFGLLALAAATLFWVIARPDRAS